MKVNILHPCKMYLTFKLTSFFALASYIGLNFILYNFTPWFAFTDYTCMGLKYNYFLKRKLAMYISKKTLSLTSHKFNLKQIEDTPNTAGREGVTGRMKSQTVKCNFTRIDRFEIASSSIISTGPLSEKNSENDGDRRTLLKDVLVDFTLST